MIPYFIFIIIFIKINIIKFLAFLKSSFSNFNNFLHELNAFKMLHFIIINYGFHSLYLHHQVVYYFNLIIPYHLINFSAFIPINYHYLNFLNLIYHFLLLTIFYFKQSLNFLYHINLSYFYFASFTIRIFLFFQYFSHPNLLFIKIMLALKNYFF